MTALPCCLLKNELVFFVAALCRLFIVHFGWTMTSSLWAYVPAFIFLTLLPRLPFFYPSPLPLEFNTSWGEIEKRCALHITKGPPPAKKNKPTCDKFQQNSPNSRCHGACHFFISSNLYRWNLASKPFYLRHLCLFCHQPYLLAIKTSLSNPTSCISAGEDVLLNNEFLSLKAFKQTLDIWDALDLLDGI